MAPKDNFSIQASLYKKFRPTYPAALYQHLRALVHHHDLAWDCGTGNGQVAVELANFFTHVHATDISEKQLQQAPSSDRITYHLLPAERTTFPDATFDLITVGQAVHWFDFDAFYAEVTRVAKPNALLALWGYGLLSISPEIDALLQHFYTQTVGPFWDFERSYIDERYATLPFPFKEEPAFTGAITTHWSISDLEGYLNSWSSVQAYIREKGENPVVSLIQQVKGVWPEEEGKEVQFPIFSRMGRIKK
ncbi:class I SAM-dependent methyltransferase [Rufibacter glacialis]|uniref:Class I SAM-dependent methyltransferase n=1 Tax=Rufibacter glacialis TaxID=1259555 RepID=A0A5M8QJH5_9BACT|nr:class I SAM-dependent methyltransferase [Rufibacter glacialis]KAA6435311.1 class I SAM-dependent methyltransferase [Rufibacter glacialis]GGK62245.1 methyltransferase [Rufibacter glacialis]